MEYLIYWLIVILCLIVGTVIEFRHSRRRKRLISEGKLRDVSAEALYVFGRVPQESVTILSGLRALFLFLSWGCAAGLIVVSIIESKDVTEYITPAGAIAAALCFTFLMDFGVRSFREAGSFFLEDRLVFQRFVKRETSYSEIRQALASEAVSIRLGFLRIPSSSLGVVKIPVSDLKADKASYEMLRTYLEERQGIRLPVI